MHCKKRKKCARLYHLSLDFNLNRVRRIRGQVEAVERALEEEKGCTEVLHIVVAARGAINSLVAEIVEGHIRMHVVDPSWERGSTRGRALEVLIEVVQTYLK
jgi:DNA-binding FrmR family transcriptional regulator